MDRPGLHAGPCSTAYHWYYQGILIPVAEVMISLPDELLARLDAQATARGTSRSATISDLAEAALGERERLLADRMTELDGHAIGHGGNVVDELEAGRPA